MLEELMLKKGVVINHPFLNIFVETAPLWKADRCITLGEEVC
jgi:hypothetical protein